MFLSCSCSVHAMNPGILRSHLTRSSLRPSIASSPSSPAAIFARHESSYRRTRKKLLVKPEATFLASTEAPQQDHIIFNPPASAPSIYHTPFKFLPKDDERRKLMATRRGGTTPSILPASSTTLPPVLGKVREKRYHLTEADVEEIRRLKREDPAKWNRGALARKFDCSELFVKMVCESAKIPTDPQRREEHVKAVEAVQARWGRKRRTAKEDRTRRRESWGRDE